MMVSIAAKLGIESPLNGESGQGATISGSDEPSNQTPAYSALAKGKARALNGDAVLRRGQTRSESRSGKVPFNPVAPIWLFAPPPSKEAQCQELCALLDMLPPTETVRAMCNFYVRADLGLLIKKPTDLVLKL